MSLLESILYGFISGVTDFLPVSSRAHQALVRYLFGVYEKNYLLELMIHIGLLLAIFVACREILAQLRIEQNALSGSRRRKRMLDGRTHYDLRLLKTAALPLIIGSLLRIATAGISDNLTAVTVFLICNAFILLVAEHSSHGNRDARTMSGLDGIVMGLLGAMSAFPGISRTGVISAYATLRGADSQHTANWAVLLGIPAIILFLCFDVIGVFYFGIGVVTFSFFVGCILAGVAAFCGGYVSISFLRAVLSNSGFSGFAYYSIGVALFSFIVYLIT